VATRRSRDAESQKARREAWRKKLRDYDADPNGWTRSYYRDMLVQHADEVGYGEARSFARNLVADGLLHDDDVDAVLRGCSEFSDDRREITDENQ
jgi:hypothetical protein